MMAAPAPRQNALLEGEELVIIVEYPSHCDPGRPDRMFKSLRAYETWKSLGGPSGGARSTPTLNW
jgi:hypothetical protein